MNDDYGYHGKNGARKGSRFVEWFIRYNKILWVLLIALALYTGRGSFSNLINTFRNWDEIQAEKGDVILVQHLFVRDRFYLQDPESYQTQIPLGDAVYSHNLRVGSDLTLEQEKIEFTNGDVYRRISIPYVDTVDVMDIETLKMFIGFKYKRGEAYYFDAQSDAWKKVGTIRGGTALPKNTLVYLIFDDKHYVLMDRLYAYSLEDDGVVGANDAITHVEHTVSQGGGWYVIQPFRMIENTQYQTWYLSSSRPLIDLQASDALAGLTASEKELILRDLGLGSEVRWLADGVYEPVPQGYTPYGDAHYYRSDSAAQLDLLLSAEDSTVCSELAFVMAYQISRNINEYGYFETPVQNTQLYESCGIRYAYADMKANAQIGRSLVTASERFGTGIFEETIRALAVFFAARLAEGELPEYWHYKGEVKLPAASQETKQETAAFLRSAAALLGDDALSALADGM